MLLASGEAMRWRENTVLGTELKCSERGCRVEKGRAVGRDGKEMERRWKGEGREMRRMER